MGPDAMILVFWMLSFKPTFSFYSFTFIKRLFSSSSLSAIRVVSSVTYQGSNWGPLHCECSLDCWPTRQVPSQVFYKLPLDTSFSLAHVEDQNVLFWHKEYFKGFPGGSDVNASACNVGDLGLIPGSRRSPGEGNGNPLQYSCLENSMEGGAW